MEEDIGVIEEQAKEFDNAIEETINTEEVINAYEMVLRNIRTERDDLFLRVEALEKQVDKLEKLVDKLVREKLIQEWKEAQAQFQRWKWIKIKTMFKR